MPSHSSHLLQPLDVGCFSVLKRVYGTLVAQGMRDGRNHVDKADMLEIHKTACSQALRPSNIESGFRATGLVPHDPSIVLDTLEIRRQTLDRRGDETALHQALQITPQADKTPRTLGELDAHFKAIQGFIQRRSKSPPSPTDTALSQLVKGAQMAMHEVTPLRAENTRLRAANAKQRQKRKSRSTYVSKRASLTIAEVRSSCVRMKFLFQCQRSLACRRCSRQTTLRRPITGRGRGWRDGHKSGKPASPGTRTEARTVPSLDVPRHSR
jgi:DDE superfamily endonuclease